MDDIKELAQIHGNYRPSCARTRNFPAQSPLYSRTRIFVLTSDFNLNLQKCACVIIPFANPKGDSSTMSKCTSFWTIKQETTG